LTVDRLLQTGLYQHIAQVQMLNSCVHLFVFERRPRLPVRGLHMKKKGIQNYYVGARLALILAQMSDNCLWRSLRSNLFFQLTSLGRRFLWSTRIRKYIAMRRENPNGSGRGRSLAAAHFCAHSKQPTRCSHRN
jgi:hypothetical protein